MSKQRREEKFVEGLLLPKAQTKGRESGVRYSKDKEYAFAPIKLLRKTENGPAVVTVAVGPELIESIRDLAPNTLVRALGLPKVEEYNGEKRYTVWASTLWLWPAEDRQIPAQPALEDDAITISQKGEDFDF